jgi:hypothetical protein
VIEFGVSLNSEGNIGMRLAGFIIAVIGLVLSPVPIINNFAALMLVVALVLSAIGWRGASKRGEKKGLAVAGVIMSVVGLVVVFGSQAFYGNALDDAAEDIEQGISEIDGSSTDAILESDLTVDFGTFEVTEDEFGIATTALEVTLTNKSDSQQSFNVQVEAVDSEGARIGDVEYVYGENLAAGQSSKQDVFTFVDEGDLEALKSAEFSVVEVSKY